MFNQFMNQENRNRLQQLMNDPKGAAQQAGWNIPEEIMGNPQAMVMHLIQTNQVGGPALQRVMPMIRQMTGK